LPDLLRDLKHAIRRLARTPGFTIATVVTLALGIGANTAIFSVINSVLLKPLPFPEPTRLIAVWQTAPGVNIKDLDTSIADYVTYREHSRTFADVALWNQASITVVEGGEAEFVEGLRTTFRLLPMLGVNPIHGRHFTEKENAAGSPDVVMIGYGYWQRRFGADPKIIGRRVMADGVAREIIGVLPREFWFMDERTDIVFPLRYDRAAIRLASYNFQCVARLRPGVTLPQANQDVARMIRIELAAFPPPTGFNTKMMEDARLGPNVRLLMDDLLGDIAPSLWVIMATVGIVLLIACANVANLLLVRADGRSHELAVRAALGAGNGRIAREFFVESLLLALLGGIVGIGFAVAVTKLVVALGPARLPRLEQISVDSTALLFTLAASIAAGFAFGALPVLKQFRTSLAGSLHSGGRGSSSGRERSFTRNTLTVVQVALALILLIGSGLMIRTFYSLRNVHPGFGDAGTLQTFRISVPRNASPTDAENRILHQNLANRLASISGVTHVGLINGLPMTNYQSKDPIYASGHTYPPDQIPPLHRFLNVAPGAFPALGTPLVAGRDYTWTDIRETRRVVIVSQNFAREHWRSGQAAIGKQIRVKSNDPWSEIIGVAADIRHDGVEQPPPSAVYWPLRSSGSISYLVRGPRAGTETLPAEIRRAVTAVNPNLPVSEMRTMRQIYDRSMSRTAFTLSLLAISGAMAFLLAVVGIYAVISYAVAQRRREIGIRLALGAQHGQLKLMFIRHGLLWSAIGIAAGLAAAFALSRLISSLLYGISPLDPLTYSAVAIALLAAAALASYLPARRITRVDPIESLRAD